MTVKYLIGIDEVGRGPLAGPVTLCAVCVRTGGEAAKNFSKIFRGVKDSKKLTPQMREEWLKVIKAAEKSGLLNYKIASCAHTTIDKIGLARAVRRALASCLRRLEISPTDCQVLLDGSLYAPPEFINQKTIIKGDEKVKIISIASIIAKVHRDALMKKLALKYPLYGFEIHKGYGTRIHREIIIKNGPCEIHRASFLRGILPVA